MPRFLLSFRLLPSDERGRECAYFLASRLLNFLPGLSAFTRRGGDYSGAIASKEDFEKKLISAPPPVGPDWVILKSNHHRSARQEGKKNQISAETVKR